MKRKGTPAKDKAEEPATPTKNNDVKRHASPYTSEGDFADFFYKSHTISVAVVAFGLMLWFAFTHDHSDPVYSAKLGVASAGGIFCVFGIVHLPDGILIRPHPAVWRFVLSLAIVYLMLMIVLMFLDLKTARYVLSFVDKGLSNDLEEHDYASDCSLSNINSVLFDIFVIAHLMGYWAKALVLRDWRIVTIVSIGFEVLEVTLQHIMPNFKECWWDHLIMDILVCNAGGTALGMMTLKYFNVKRYHWVKLTDIQSIKGKAKRVLDQFNPRSMELYQWNVFTSARRCLQAVSVVTVMFIQELNCFAMKFVLHMEPNHPIVFLRLAMWGFFALPGLREFYDYCSDPNCKRLGTMAWVGSGALLCETVMIVKYAIEARTVFTVPWPAHIALPWMFSLVCWVMWFVLFFGLKSFRMQPNAAASLWRLFLNALLYAPCVAFLAMFAMGNVDMQWYQKEFDAFVIANGLWKP